MPLKLLDPQVRRPYSIENRGYFISFSSSSFAERVVVETCRERICSRRLGMQPLHEEF